MRKVIGALGLVFAVSGVFSQESSSNAGTASILLLRIGPNPRISSMSEAFSGLANDENALYYNPAGLSTIASAGISLNHTEWFEDIRIENLTFAYPISKKMGIGLGLTHLWMPSIESFDYLGQSLGSIDVSSSIVDFGFSYKIQSAFSVGIGVKYFQEKLATYSAAGFGFDLGLLLKTMISGLSVGIAAQNYGGNIKYDQQNQKIPLTFRGGLSYQLARTSLLFSLDVIKSSDSDIRIYLGSEYTFNNQLSLRIGNKFSEAEIFTPSFGAGFHLQGRYNFYYTYGMYSDLGGIHQLGFTFNFGNPSKYKSKPLYYPSQPLKLVPPENVKVDIIENELRISWDRVSGVQYNVYAKHSTQEKWVKLNKSLLYNNSIKFKKPKSRGIYYFRVSSQYNGKESSFSKEASIYVK